MIAQWIPRRLASSIFIVARRREGDETGSYEQDVRPELQRIVRERVERLWAQGVTGADLVIACVGAGLRAFTKYARVEYANGEPVPADGFLAEVEGAVLEALLEKIFGVSQAGVSSVDAATRFYVLWRYAYRQAAIDAGEAIIFAYPQHVELDGSRGLTGGGNPLVEKQAGKYRLRDFTERGEDEKLGLPHNGSPRGAGGRAAPRPLAGGAPARAHPRVPGRSPARHRAPARRRPDVGGADAGGQRQRRGPVAGRRARGGGRRVAEVDDELAEFG